MTTTPGKGLFQPTIGGDNNTWGGLLNNSLSLIDSALGGTLAKSVSGNTTLSGTECQNTGYKFTGTLSGNATITWSPFLGMAMIQNATTGGFALICGISGGTVTVFAGETVAIWSDGTDFARVAATGGHSDGSMLLKPPSAVANLLTIDNRGTLIEPISYGLGNVRLSTNLDNTGSLTDMDQFGLMVQVSITGNTGSTINYERAAGLFWARTADPSGATARDCVGLDARGYASVGNMTARLWGLYGEFRLVPGSDGIATGLELDLFNDSGIDQPNLNTTTSKYGIVVNADGGTPVTAGLRLGGVNNYFHRGLSASGGSGGNIGTGATDRFIVLDKAADGSYLFDVDANGNVNAPSYKVNTATVLSASGAVLTLGSGTFSGGILAGTTFYGNSHGISVTNAWNSNYLFDCQNAFARFSNNTASLPASDASGGWVFAWNRSQNNAENVAYNVSDNGGGFDFRQKTGAATSQSVFAVGGTGALSFGGSASFTANGSVATSLGSVGPTGAHTTVQKWFTVSDGTNTYYIPAF